ncbi:hypothetical protein NFI96_033033 [Prochilodus magdalenae]|nr:hypothetical protein NFI96_033033 [Prochilodus magdalenae]
MNSQWLLCCLVFCSACWETVKPHMLMEKLSDSNLTSTASIQNQTYSPPVLIVEDLRAVKLIKEDEEIRAELKKDSSRQPLAHRVCLLLQTKLAGRVKRPPPPPNCAPLWGSCKSPNSVCCEHCAFCSCRLLRTVCYCRMGYPRC